MDGAGLIHLDQLGKRKSILWVTSLARSEVLKDFIEARLRQNALAKRLGFDF